MAISKTESLGTRASSPQPSRSFPSPNRNGTSSDTPDGPVVVVEPSRSLVNLELREIWLHRELLYFMIWRDLKIRYKQTVFGVGWVILQPLLMTFVFTMVLGRLGRVPSGNVPYAIFSYAGLMLWIFFSGAISLIGNCLVGNANLITKVYFPRLIIPLATMIARLVDLGAVFIILIGLMLYYRVHPTLHLLAIPFFVVLLSLFALGFGLWISAANVKYRDVGLALPVLIQLWMFLSPVVYGIDALPPKLRLPFSLNPLVGILEGFRASLFGTPFFWPAIGISTLVTTVLLVYGAYAFQRRQKTFADIL